MLTLLTWIASPFRYRFLLFSFVLQDLRAQVAGSAGGGAWLLLKPLMTIGLYVFVFSVVLRLKIDLEEVGTDQFVLYLLAGLLPWLAFADAINRAPALLLEKASIITKVSFPLETLPFSIVLVSFIVNGVGMLLFWAYLLIAGSGSVYWLALPLLLLFFVLFTTGLAALLSATGVFLRDIAQLVGILLSLLFYLTPILYPVSLVPDRYLTLYNLNPMLPFVESFQSILLLGELPLSSFVMSGLFGIALFLFGGFVFLRLRHAYNDVL